jgi:hypothetical protein
LLSFQTEIDPPLQSHPPSHPSTTVPAASAGASANVVVNDFTLSPEMTDCDSADLVTFFCVF